jgi:chromosome segregation ATPase
LEIIERQAEVQAELSRRQAEFHSEQSRLNAEANARHDRVDRQIQELIQSMSIFRDALISITHQVERNEREMADLIERGKQTDARLNALILVVESHISGHQ